MSLSLLFVDEIKGFYKSKVMAVLWIGMPFITITLHALQPNAEGISFLYIVGLLVASMSGLIGCVTLATSISTELNNHVYDLFLIRPVKRANLLLAKFIAIALCILVAMGFAYITGFILDIMTIGIPNEVMLHDTLISVSLSITAMAIACSLGVLIGLIISSVAVSAIVAIYAGGQFSALIALIPALLTDDFYLIIVILCMGVVVVPIILFTAITLFDRKQL